jgi:atypical dual specificity phosphatase
MANRIYEVSQVTEIIKNLYLTSVYGATKEAIQRKGITLLVNAAQELPKQEISGVESIKLYLDDTPYATIHIYFDRIADRIHEHLNRGGRAIVHCMLGVSRSTSLVLAYLMKYRKMSLKSSFELVSARRPIVRPNPGFWKQLIEYEKKLSSTQISSNTHSSMGTSIPIKIMTPNRPPSSSQQQPVLSNYLLSSSANKPHTPYHSNNFSNRPFSSASSTKIHNDYSISKSMTDFDKNSYLKNSYYEPLPSGRLHNDLRYPQQHYHHAKPADFSTTYRSSFVRY